MLTTFRSATIPVRTRSSRRSYSTETMWRWYASASYYCCMYHEEVNSATDFSREAYSRRNARPELRAQPPHYRCCCAHVLSARTARLGNITLKVCFSRPSARYPIVNNMVMGWDGGEGTGQSNVSLGLGSQPFLYTRKKTLSHHDHSNSNVSMLRRAPQAENGKEKKNHESVYLRNHPPRKTTACMHDIPPAFWLRHIRGCMR